MITLRRDLLRIFHWINVRCPGRCPTRGSPLEDTEGHKRYVISTAGIALNPARNVDVLIV